MPSVRQMINQKGLWKSSTVSDEACCYPGIVCFYLWGMLTLTDGQDIPPSHHKPMKFLVREASGEHLGKLFFPRKLLQIQTETVYPSPAKSEPISEPSALTSILLHPSFKINKATSFPGIVAPKILWNQVCLGDGIPHLEDSLFLKMSDF